MILCGLMRDFCASQVRYSGVGAIIEYSVGVLEVFISRILSGYSSSV